MVWLWVVVGAHILAATFCLRIRLSAPGLIRPRAAFALWVGAMAVGLVAIVPEAAPFVAPFSFASLLATPWLEKAKQRREAEVEHANYMGYIAAAQDSGAKQDFQRSTAIRAGQIELEREAETYRSDAANEH